MDAAPAAVTIDRAAPADVGALAGLETRAFAADRIARASFRRLVRSPSADVLVARGPGAGLAGAAVVLYRRTSPLARLYSLAVAPELRGQGVARRLVGAAEAAAAARGKRAVRLEVRADNAAALGLYQELGYRPFGGIAGYYADGAAALRLAKAIGSAAAP